jgi:hypothetical protein
MAGFRIRWRGVAKVAAIALVGLLAVRLLPGFLRAPEPPPLSADVGLPKAAPVTDVPRPAGTASTTDKPQSARTAPKTDAPRPTGTAQVTDVPRPTRHPRKQRRRARRRRSRPRKVRDAPAAKAVIGSKRRHRVAGKPARDPKKVARSTPPPAPPYVPPTVPEAIPEPLPEPSAPLPSTPGDGSQEFAPH